MPEMHLLNRFSIYSNDDRNIVFVQKYILPQKRRLKMIVNSSSYKDWMMVTLFLLVNCVMGFAQPTISATQLYMEYNDNQVRFERNYQGKQFYITGEVLNIRRGLLGGYVVDLRVPGDWNNVFGATISVVFPQNQSTQNELAKLEEGENIRILVIGRAEVA